MLDCFAALFSLCFLLIYKYYYNESVISVLIILNYFYQVCVLDVINLVETKIN